MCIRDSPDEHFFVSVGRTRSDAYVLISSASKTTTEMWFVPTDEPDATPRVISPREQGVEYSVDHHASDRDGSRFLVLTNVDGAENFTLCSATVDAPGREHWHELVAHDPQVRLERVDAFVDHIVVSERANGLERLRVLDLSDPERSHTIALPDPVSSVWTGANLEFDTTTAVSPTRCTPSPTSRPPPSTSWPSTTHHPTGSPPAAPAPAGGEPVG